jgi:hypothetical protein
MLIPCTRIITLCHCITWYIHEEIHEEGKQGILLNLKENVESISKVRIICVNIQF